MPIISSKITVRNTQSVGSYLTEQHIDQDGNEYLVEYLNTGQDENAVMAARAVNIGERIDADAAVAAEAVNFEIPLMPIDFLNRLTVQERIAIRSNAANDPIIADFLDLLGKAKSVYRSHADTNAGLDYLSATNNPATGAPYLASGRKAEILS